MGFLLSLQHLFSQHGALLDTVISPKSLRYCGAPFDNRNREPVWNPKRGQKLG